MIHAEIVNIIIPEVGVRVEVVGLSCGGDTVEIGVSIECLKLAWLSSHALHVCSIGSGAGAACLDVVFNAS